MGKVVGRSATYEAGPNIALVKYWGVRDPTLVLPYNSSLSVTLGRFRTRTTVSFEPVLVRDEFTLNGAPIEGTPRDDVVRFLDRVRNLSHRSERARVRSSNNFPTASGLASSASGFAALAGAASAAAGLRPTPRALSQLARLGSGSASRSVFGGFVEWRAGSRADGADCYAAPIASADHWPELLDRVAMVRDAPVKTTRSALAMQSTVASSRGYAQRLADVPGRIARLERAIRDRDAETLFATTIEECDSFRSVCETTDPPLDYLTATSRSILAAVRAANDEAGRPVAAYTHDAGAHVHVFTLDGALSKLRKRLDRIAGVERWLTVRPGAGARRVGGPT
ncbi:MAG: diphosphomevalonate decarboxylase [Thermoplasmata archaeon]|nr:diphosphomevalonate decarboxylase [Thermoplasmata archaeon]MCI4359727.1 diphosphomevalonate decarboxylase [Thermoplasmata archaeon]